ncbi:hypothetical protein TI05_14430 [Achromatium sp. WMS3]|nr:hypothetical protein TI05_14430 [Achromatium sp. WMS3]
MELLQTAASSLPTETRYIVRPHPTCKINPTNYPALPCEISSSPLEELLENSDVAFTSNITSAAIDSYCFGIPVISVLDGNAFNMSPLRSIKNIVYFTSTDELTTALSNIRQHQRKLGKPYFCLDKKLPIWRNLLDLY